MAQEVSFLRSENLVNKVKVKNVFFFLNYFPFNRSFEYFYYFLLSIFLQIGWWGEGGGGGGGEGKIP